MAALKPFCKTRPCKRPAAAVEVVSLDDDEESQEIVIVEKGRPHSALVKAGTRVAIHGAGTAVANGTYAARSDGEGGFLFRREGGGECAIAWWDEQPGSWMAGWYIFDTACELGLYCSAAGDEAHFPLVAWSIYSGPDSTPGTTPPPSVESLEARATSQQLLGVSVGSAVLLRLGGLAEANGTYVAEEGEEGSLQFTKEGDARFAIAWWDEQPDEWEAGWYVFKVEEEEEGLYFTAQGDEEHLPLAHDAWEVYSGAESGQGLAPPPAIMARGQRTVAKQPMVEIAAACECVYLRVGLHIHVRGAGTEAANGTYVAGFDDEGCLKLTQQGDCSAYCIAWWDSEPGQWRAGWYIFMAESEQGVYTLQHGDEARFPLGTWEVYSGPESSPGVAPAPSTTSEQVCGGGEAAKRPRTG